MNTSIQTATHTQLVNTFTTVIGDLAQLAVDARELHSFLQVGRDFTNWIKGRISKYGFVENQDFIVISRSPELASGNRGAATDYHLTLDTAKELSMVENNQQGRMARRYFIAMEKQAIAALLAPVKYISQKQYQELVKTVQHIAGNFQYNDATNAIWALLRQQTGVAARYIAVSRFEQAKQHLQAIAAQCKTYHELIFKAEGVLIMRCRAFFNAKQQAEVAFLKQNVDLVPVEMQSVFNELMPNTPQTNLLGYI